MFEELDVLFESATIKPSFDKVHVILALFLFEENKEGIGRYRLGKELMMGAGTVKSMIKKLNEKMAFITVLTKENLSKGHILTKKGLEFVKEIKKVIQLIEIGDSSVLKDIIIKAEDGDSYFCLVREASNKISNGIEQRDAAIKIGGVGATCLIYNGRDLIFPSKTLSGGEEKPMSVDQDIFNYIFSLLDNKNISLRKNDVILIGLGENLENARLSALNAALTLV
ncbi:MAG: DUF4443 domain-containing protein [Promethearchaeota archaeon]